MARLPFAVIQIWDVSDNDLPDTVIVTHDHEIIELIQSACNPERSQLQQPLVTRMEPVNVF